MKQRLRDAVKMEQEILQETELAYAVAAADPTNAAQALKNARQCAGQLHFGEVSNFMEDVPAPTIISGEVVPTEAERGDHEGGWALRNTLATPHTAAIAASIDRSELLSESSIDVLALGVDAAESVGSSNSLEKMLVHQMALAHKTSFQLADRAMQESDSVETGRLINASARMMTVYQRALLALNRLRTGGKQIVTVQHVNVGSGGQALVTGNLQTGERADAQLRGQQ